MNRDESFSIQNGFHILFEDDPFKVKGQVNSQIFYFQRLFGKVSALRKIFHIVGYRTAGSAYIAVTDRSPKLAGYSPLLLVFMNLWIS